MSKPSKHFTIIKWLAKLHQEEVTTIKEHGHLDNDTELEIKLGAVTFAYEEAVEQFRKNEQG